MIIISIIKSLNNLQQVISIFFIINGHSHTDTI